MSFFGGGGGCWGPKTAVSVDVFLIIGINKQTVAIVYGVQNAMVFVCVFRCLEPQTIKDINNYLVLSLSVLCEVFLFSYRRKL